MSVIVYKPYPTPRDGIPKSPCHYDLKLGDCFVTHAGTGLTYTVTTLTDQIVELRQVGTINFVSGLLGYFNQWANDNKIVRPPDDSTEDDKTEVDYHPV